MVDVKMKLADTVVKAIALVTAIKYVKNNI